MNQGMEISIQGLKIKKIVVLSKVRMPKLCKMSFSAFILDLPYTLKESYL